MMNLFEFQTKSVCICVMSTVMIFGTFDILHHGHLHLFQQVRKYGDRVITIVARDTTVEKIKGHAAFHNEKERKAFLDHIDLIDKAILGDRRDVYKVIQTVKPDVICLGYDQETFVDALEEKIKEFDLQTKIIRLKPYKHERYKTSKVKKYLDTII